MTTVPMRLAFAATPLFLALATALAHSKVGDPKTDEEWFSHCLGIEVHDLEEAPPLSQSNSEKIVEIVATDADSLGEINAYSAVEAIRDGTRPLRIALAQLAGPASGQAVLVALTQDGSFAAVAVIDEEGEPDAEWTHFLEQMQFQVAPTVAESQPVSTLQERRGELAGKQDEEARLNLALLDLMEAMQKQASAYNLPESPTADTMRMMEQQYSRVAELADPLRPLLGEQAERFAEIAGDSAARCREVADAMDARDQEAASSAAPLITQNCRACHNLKGLAVEGLLKDVSSETRASLGIGDGYFVVGYDLRIRHPDGERSQAVADGIRAAALVLDAAR